jgi:MFS family permease
MTIGTIGPSPSDASLRGLDGVNFFIAGILAGFGPYVAAYLADQKWTQDNIGFVLTASGLAGLLSQLPGGELLDAIRSKRAIVVAGATMVAISAIIIAFQPSFPVVLTGLALQGITGGFLGLAIAAISLGLVGHAALPQRLGRNQRFASTGSLVAAGLMGLIGYFLSYQAIFLTVAALHPSAVRCSRPDPCNRHPLRPRVRGAPSRHV